MSQRSWWLARQAGLGKPEFRAKRDANIRVVMPDGVELATDHYAPDAPGPHPTLLLRLPYGREGFGGLGEIYAERGFNVVIQACRGTEASGGEFDPLANERSDGLATLEWLKAQPWFDGRLGLTGPSYLGYAQWAIVDAPGIMAISTKVTSAEFRSVVFPGNGFNLGLGLGWLQTVEGLSGNTWLLLGQMMTGAIERRTQRAGRSLPLKDADRAAIGRPVEFWQNWFDSMIDDGPRWEAMDHRHRIGADTPPNHFVSGWYDFMVDQLLRDYQAQVAAGQRPYLTVGSWYHTGEELQLDTPKETLAWMRAHLMGDRSGLRDKPVRFEIGGTRHWVETESFPPGPSRDTTLHLQPAGSLVDQPAGASDPDSYVYDPHDPTPSVGGAMFAFKGAGAQDNRKLEQRADVLVYTGPVLEQPVTIVGNVAIRLFARAEHHNVDFFVRLCDVDARGRSVNVCDGFVHLTSETPVGPDGVWELRFAMHATAHCFAAGHRLRVQVSSGAYPRYARNTGTGESIGTATTLVPNRVHILHDGQHPSAVTLPVYDL